MSWSLLARFSTPGEAELARSALEAADVDVVIADEEMVSLNWLYSNAVGGIKLLVPEEDLERAATILTTPSAETDVEVEQEVVEREPPPVLRCPACGSDQVVRIPRLLLCIFFALTIYGLGVAIEQRELAAAGVVVAVLITLFARSHRCISCGEKFSAVEPQRDADEAPLPEPFDTIDDACPRCGSIEYHRIDYRNLKLIPLFFNPSILAILPIWMVLPKKKCDNCGFKGH